MASWSRSETALADLYERYGDPCFRYLALLLGSRDDADDVMQEAFLRLHRAARRDPGVLQIRMYVMRVARNEAYRFLARRRRQTWSSDGLLRPVADGRSEAERLAISEALGRLPPEQREVIHLKVYMNMTFAEIAELTGMPLNTAASRYRYALEKLRTLLGEEDKP